MVNLPVIDMVRTGHRLRKQAGSFVKNMKDIFGFTTPQAIYKWQQESCTADHRQSGGVCSSLVRLDDILVTDAAEQM